MEHLETPVRTVHHVSFRVDDIDDSLDFYCRVLGCERLPRPDLGYPGAWLRTGDVEVHLLQFEATDDSGHPPSGPGPMANHVAFLVDDADGVRRHFERHGVPIATIPEGDRQFWIQDPSGNSIEFIQAR